MRWYILVVVAILAGAACASIDPDDNGVAYRESAVDNDGGVHDLRPPPPDFWRICEPDWEGFTSTGSADSFCKGKGDGGTGEEQRRDGCTPFYFLDGAGNRVASPVCCPGLVCTPPASRPEAGTLCLWTCK